MVIVLIISCAGALAPYNIAKYITEKNINVDSFDSCIDAGYKLIESSPQSCIDSKGNTFFQTQLKSSNHLNTTIDYI